MPAYKGLTMKTNSPQNIFVIRSDRFGEFLLSLPAIKIIKTNFPSSKIYLLAQPVNTELIRGVDFIDEYLDYDDDFFRGYPGALRLSKIQRAKKIDCLVAMNPKKEFHLASLLALTNMRVGYDRKFGFCLNRKIEDEKYKGAKHEVEYNLDLMRLFCRNVYVPKIDLAIDEKETLSFISGSLDLTKKYTVIHPFSSNPAKKIKEDFWLNLAQRLKLTSANDIVIIGSKEEMGEAEKLSTCLGAKDLTGKLSLRNLASFLKYNCGLFIGLDSGPMHLASMLGLPVVGLFKISDSKRWGPFNTKSLVLENKCEEDLSRGIEDIVKFACSK